jgi:acyl-coenzyme A synthetase/AMP-(fatty) acid ligase
VTAPWPLRADPPLGTHRGAEELERALFRHARRRSGSVDLADAAAWTQETSWLVDWSRVRPRSLAELPDLVLRTSGHTGRPAAWIRTGAQLAREVALLREIARVDECDGVVTFAPPKHLYGLLFGYCVPAAARLPVRHVAASEWPAFDPSALGLRRPLLAALPAVLPLLRSLGSNDGVERATIVHSTSSLPEVGREVAALPRVELVELFGSTETGLVAHRSVAGGESDEPWLLADDVEAVAAIPDDVGTLVVAGPRIARRPGAAPPPALGLGDVVEHLDDRRFRFVGRTSRLVKVNGRRLDLDEVETTLRRTLRCADLACLPRRDEVRGESYDLLVVPADGGTDPAAVRARGAPVFAELAPPRRVRLVGELPRSATGKLLASTEARDV